MKRIFKYTIGVVILLAFAACTKEETPIFQEEARVLSITVTDGGYAKRTSVDQYRTQSRGGLGIKVAKLNDDRGVLAGGLIVSETDEVLVVLASGKVVRSSVAEVPAKGRDTMGVVFARFGDDDRILAIARNGERGLTEDAASEDATAPDAPPSADTEESGSDA